MSLQRNGNGFNSIGSGSGAFLVSKASTGLSQTVGTATSPLCAAVLTNADDARLSSLLSEVDEFGDTVLGREIEACEEGNNFSVSLGVLRCLLAKRWSLRPYLWRQTLLTGARSGRACLLQVLQDQDPEAWTAALRYNDGEDGKAEANESEGGPSGSVLHWAAAGGHPGLLVSLAKSLRVAGGDVFSVDEEGNTFADVFAERHRRLLPDLWTFEPTPATAADDFRRLLELVDPPITTKPADKRMHNAALKSLASATWQVKRLASRKDGESSRERAERARQAVRLCALADNCGSLVTALAILDRLRPADIDEDFLRELTLAGWSAAVRPLLLLAHARPIECCLGVANACCEALRRLHNGDVGSGVGGRFSVFVKQIRAWCLARATFNVENSASVALLDLKRCAENTACAALERVWSVAVRDDRDGGGAFGNDCDDWRARVHRHFFEGRQPRLRPWRTDFDALSRTECVRAYTERVWQQMTMEPPTSLKQLPRLLLLTGPSPRMKLIGQCVSLALLILLLLVLAMKQGTAELSRTLYIFTWLCFLCQTGQEAQEFFHLRCLESQVPQLHPALSVCWALASTATVLGLTLRPLEPLAFSGRVLLAVSVLLWLVGLLNRVAACQLIGRLLLQAGFVIIDDLLPMVVILLPLIALTTILIGSDWTVGQPIITLLGNETETIEYYYAGSSINWQKNGTFQCATLIWLVLSIVLLTGRVPSTLKRRSDLINRQQLRHRLATALRLRDASPGPLPVPLNLVYAVVFVWRQIFGRRVVRLRRGRHQDCGVDLSRGRSNGGDSYTGGGNGSSISGNGIVGTLGRRSRPSESDARATQCMYQSGHAGLSAAEAEDGSTNPLFSAASAAAAASCAHRDLRQFQLFQAGALRGFRAHLAELSSDGAN